MVGSNAEVARLLGELATLTELEEGSPQAFRVRAYQNAQRAVEHLPTDVAEMSASQLAGVKGVGKSTAAKIREYKKLGFDGVQFHDDDVVPADLDAAATERGVAEVKKMLDGEGLFCEFIAPRLWEHPRTIHGAYTANSAAERQYAIDSSKRAIAIARQLNCKDMVL